MTAGRVPAAAARRMPAGLAARLTACLARRAPRPAPRGRPDRAAAATTRRVPTGLAARLTACLARRALRPTPRGGPERAPAATARRAPTSLAVLAAGLGLLGAGLALLTAALPLPTAGLARPMAHLARPMARLALPGAAHAQVVPAPPPAPPAAAPGPAPPDLPGRPAPPAVVEELRATLARAVERFQARDLDGVMVHLSEQYRTGPFTKPTVRAQLTAMFAVYDAMRVRVQIDEVRLVGEHAWVYSTGDAAGRLPYVGQWIRLFWWERELEVARREQGAWRLFGYQQ